MKKGLLIRSTCKKQEAQMCQKGCCLFLYVARLLINQSFFFVFHIKLSLYSMLTYFYVKYKNSKAENHY